MSVYAWNLYSILGYFSETQDFFPKKPVQLKQLPKIDAIRKYQVYDIFK